MNEKDERLIWRYLDGDLDDREKSVVQHRIKNDEAFREAFMKRELLQKSLQATEPEMPSMRFTQNVMEKLPQLYRYTVRPLLPKVLVRGFALVMAMFAISMLVLPFLHPDGGGATDPLPLLENSRRLSNAIVNVPKQWYLFVAVLSLSYLALLALDRYLRKRFGL